MENLLEKYETIEQAVAMPLDKFARIFKEGVYYKGPHYPCDIRDMFIATYKNDKSQFRVRTMEYSFFGEILYLEDYGKTWCLMSEHEVKPMSEEERARFNKVTINCGR